MYSWDYTSDHHGNEGENGKRSYRYAKNRSSIVMEYKKALSMIMLLCIKQNLSNIWTSVHEKIKEPEPELKKKSIAYKKSVYLSNNLS